MEDLVTMERRAVDATFCDAATRADLHAALDAFAAGLGGS
jgi:hypothetical protein